MLRRIAVLLIAALSCTPGFAQLDTATLSEAYRTCDLARNQGLGYADATDSAVLAWQEGGILKSYIDMWEVTGDSYWLDRLVEHFEMIAANATDPEGDGYLGWQTAEYSAGIAYAHRLHNVSAAEIGPAEQRIKVDERLRECTGHTYIVEFQTGPERFRIRDWDTQEIIADAVTYGPAGATIDQIVPFTFTLTGQTHQGDRFMIRTIAPQHVEHIAHEGMIAYPVARFIEAVKTTSELQARYGAKADAFLAFITRNLFEKNERHWVSIEPLGGAYRAGPWPTERAPNVMLPHNQYLSLGRAWLVLGSLRGVNPAIGERARQMAGLFHSLLMVDDATDACTWHYMDWLEYGDGLQTAAEDTMHGHIDVGFAVEAARRGIVFTSQDMQRLANTWLRLMWNQDADRPRIAGRVDGSAPGKHPALLTSWTELAEWNPQVHTLAAAAWSELDPAEQARWAPTMLLCEARGAHPANVTNP